MANATPPALQAGEGTVRVAAVRGAHSLVLVSNLYPPYVVGGAELVVSHLAEGLAASGLRVSVLTTGPPGTNAGAVNCEERDGVRVFRFFPRNSYWVYERKPRSFLRKALWHLRDSWNSNAAETYREILQEVQPDIVHTHNLDGISPAVWHVARTFSVPVVHTLHDCHLLCPRATLLRQDGTVCRKPNPVCGIYRRWYRAMSGKINVLCAPSQFILDLHREAGLEPPAFERVANGVPQSGDDADKPSQDDGIVRFLFLGALAPHKGLHTLLDAVQELKKEAVFELHLAGDGPLRDKAEAAAACDGRIQVHGFLHGAEKEKLLHSCDLLIFSSVCYENAPLAIVESMVHGLGVVASHIGGVPELVSPGVNGWLFPPGDVRALRNCIEQALSDQTRLRLFQQQARETARSATSAAMCNHYIRIYNRLHPGP